MAPFMPFYSEALYRSVKDESCPESVHLCNWPKAKPVNKKIINEMNQVRNIVSLGLEARANAGFKIRQPLRSVSVERGLIKDVPEYIELIKDEVNVKEVIFCLEKGSVNLDTELSEDLKQEGLLRDIIRQIQQFRKESNLTTEDKILIAIDTDEELNRVIQEFKEEIKQKAFLKEIIFENISEEGIFIDGKRIVFKIK